jgi:hypothetical protein
MKKLLLFLMLSNSALAQVEPTAGTWKTWVITDKKDYILPPPPDNQKTFSEVKSIIEINSSVETNWSRSDQKSQR